MLRPIVSVSVWLGSLAALSFALPGGLPAQDPAPAGEALSLVVMDPLAAPLSCPCVAGYAQRKYEKLAEYLQQRLKRPVRVDVRGVAGEGPAGRCRGPCRLDHRQGLGGPRRCQVREAKSRPPWPG